MTPIKDPTLPNFLVIFSKISLWIQFIFQTLKKEIHSGAISDKQGLVNERQRLNLDKGQKEIKEEKSKFQREQNP